MACVTHPKTVTPARASFRMVTDGTAFAISLPMTTQTTMVDRLKLTDVELTMLLERPRLVLRSKTTLIKEYAGKFEQYSIDSDGMETFQGYLTKE